MHTTPEMGGATVQYHHTTSEMGGATVHTAVHLLSDNIMSFLIFYNYYINTVYFVYLFNSSKGQC